jgi:fatty acyl-CoA reductase
MVRNTKTYGHTFTGFFFFRLVKIYKKINRFCNVLSYFSTHEWKFTNNNIQELWKKLNEDDKKVFDFDIDGLDWDRYLYNYVRGIRIYLLKEDLSTVPQGLARQKRYINLHTMQCSEHSKVKI